MKAVVDRTVDLSIVWGPIAGYYAKQLGADLVLTPVADDTVSGIPFVYSMGMATRRRERSLRDSLQKFIDTRGAEIRDVLRQYGVPLLALPADSAAAGSTVGSGR